MNSTTTNLSQIKEQFIGNLEFCFGRGISSNPEYLVYSFLFDNITLLSDIELKDIDKEDFCVYSNENKKLEEFIKESLLSFKESLQKTRRDTPLSYRINSKQENTVENVFLGLTYSGNNDSDYKNVPSALSLATFIV